MSGTEGSGSVYPIGAETVMPGLTPAAGQTMFAEFNTTYQANGFLDGQGHSAVPGFRLSVYAFAPKITHNWGVHLLGGDLVSWVAIPFAYEWVRTPAGTYSTTGISNPILGVADIAYNRGNWHWWYGLDVETPAPVYHKGGPINVGQHNFATAPSGAFTYLPHHGRTEISSRLQYIVNYTDPATHYHSGNEFLWEYVAMQNVTKKLAIGANGYFYQQTTADRLLGVIYAGGNQGRDLAIGPEVHYRTWPRDFNCQVFPGHAGAKPAVRKRLLDRVRGPLVAPASEAAGPNEPTELTRGKESSWRGERALNNRPAMAPQSIVMLRLPARAYSPIRG